MPCSRIYSATFMGIDALRIEIEVDIQESDKFHLVIVGLPDTATKESKDRVLTAIKNSGYTIHNMHCTVNLAPAHLRKVGTLYDLPIALALLMAHHHMAQEPDLPMAVGELALSGDIRPIQGLLAIALCAKKAQCRKLIVPTANAPEAALIQGVEIYAFAHLKECFDFLRHPKNHSLFTPQKRHKTPPKAFADFSDIRGQFLAKRGLEIAAAGGHNILLVGPPGAGKTLLAKALPSILPPLTLDEAIEVTQIYSVAGLLPEGCSLIENPPFRSPHHTVSHVGMIGGGTLPRPGEVSLAHRGVLFLDEFPEFTRQALEVLRQPIEDGVVSIVRAGGRFTFPTRFLCIAAMNPCPCGYYGHPQKPCRDSQLQIENYIRKISGPLIDRIDLVIPISPVDYEELSYASQPAERSSQIRERITQVRGVQYQRFQCSKTNSAMEIRELKHYAPIDEASSLLLKEAMATLHLTARAYHRLLKVARTIADLGGSQNISEEHILEALQFRSHTLR